MPTFLCDGLTVNMLAAWLWSVVETYQSTYFKTVCARFDWCLCCHNSLFPASTLVQPSSEVGIYLCAYFASGVSGKNTAVIIYSLLGHINILFSELLKVYPHQLCSSVFLSPDDDRVGFAQGKELMKNYDCFEVTDSLLALADQSSHNRGVERDNYPKTLCL